MACVDFMNLHCLGGLAGWSIDQTEWCVFRVSFCIYKCYSAHIWMSAYDNSSMCRTTFIKKTTSNASNASCKTEKNIKYIFIFTSQKYPVRSSWRNKSWNMQHYIWSVFIWLNQWIRGIEVHSCSTNSLRRIISMNQLQQHKDKYA